MWSTLFYTWNTKVYQENGCLAFSLSGLQPEKITSPLTFLTLIDLRSLLLAHRLRVCQMRLRTQLTVEMVKWTLWCDWKNDQSLPTNFDQERSNYETGQDGIWLPDIIWSESNFLPKRLGKVEVPYTGIAGLWEPGHLRLSDVEIQIAFITTRGSSHYLYDMFADVYKCNLKKILI